MLTTDEHLESTQSALALAEKALAAVHRERATMRPEWYKVMAGPAADMVRDLRRQIDEYIGLNEPLLKEDDAAPIDVNGSNGAGIEHETAKSA